MAEGLITRWPGSSGGEAPLSAIMAMSGRVPMFAGDNGPRYTGPFNAGGDYGSILQLVMPQIMQSLMGSEHMPAQFFPEQNLHEQMEANKYLEASQSAMQAASRRDTGTIESMLAGLTQMMTKQPLTQLQQSRNYRIAEGISSYMPILSQVLGPDLIDQLHGSRGSATVFAQQMHQALRTSIDPISHTVGYTGASSGQITQETFEKLFGQGADLGMMKGMSAGQAGILVNELQARGMLGQPTGVLPLQEQRALLPKELTSDTVNRLAEQLPEIKKILQEKGTPDDASLARARETIRGTHKTLTDPQVNLDQDTMEQLPGAQEIMRTGDAARISQRLKNLSGAVKAMRDIFGDMGNPNAPMREIINGLEALTQGGLSTMSPGQLEMMVRKTHTIAKSTGIGVEGMMALTSQNAALADQLGLDRTFAVTAAQQAANFGAAAGDNLRLDIPVWGAMSKEQLLLGDQQLRMHAAASPLANQLNAVMRMTDTGMAAPAEGTELAAFTAAIRQGKTTYEFGGKQQDIVMPHSHMIEMMKRDAGVNETEAYAVLSDITGNQEFGQIHNTTDTVRRVQINETARRMLTPVLGDRLRGMLADSGIDQLLQAEGITNNETDFREMMNRLGEGVGQDFIKLDPAVVRSAPQKRQALGASFKNRLTAEVKAKMPQAADAEVAAVVEGLVTQMGGEQAMEKMGTALQATINSTAKTHPLFKSDVAMHNLLNLGTMTQASARDRQDEMSAMTQSALAGLGTADPVRRLADIFQNATAETTLQEVLTSAMGGVSIDAIKAADPKGGLAKVFGLIQENKKLDANDPKQLEQARRNNSIIKALVEGGDVATEQLRILDASRTRIGTENLPPAERERRKLRDAEFTTQQTKLTETTRQLEKVRTTKPPEGNRLTAAAQALAATLGDEELATGDGRFVTSRGVVTRDAAGAEQSVAALSDTETARAAVAAMQNLAAPATADKAKISSVVQAMAATLGNKELAVGDGRFVTSRGIVTRDAAGNEQAVTGFEDIDASRTALGALQRYTPPVSTEQTKVTQAVQAMADTLGSEELAVGGGRFVTKRGVVTRDAAGVEQSVLGFENVDAARLALDAMQQRQTAAVTAAHEADYVQTGKAALAASTPPQQAKALQELDAADLRQQKRRDAQFTIQQTRLTETANRLNRLAEDKVPADEVADEQRLATGSVRAMAQSLGKEEIAIGGNRFLTQRGIVTKNAAGQVQSVAGFDDLQTAQETLSIFQKRHNTAVEVAKQTDDATATQPREQRLGRAAELGLLRGDLTGGNADLQQHLSRAEKRDSDTSILGDLGYGMSAKVSVEQVQATLDSKDRADKLLKEEPGTADTADAVATFVLGSRERGRQLLEDERSMNIIGRGGTELIRGAMAGADQLQILAAEQSKKLNRKVEIAELISGGKGISAEVKQQANDSYQTLNKWLRINKLRGYRRLPGKGDDPENLQRPAMTDQEREDLAAQQQFTKEFTTPEARAAEVVDQLSKLVTPEQKDRLTADTNRELLIKEIAKGDRGISLRHSIHSRQELLEMGLRKGLFAGKTKLSELTDEEEVTVAAKLEALDLSEAEQADFERLHRSASSLMDFGMKDMRASDIMPDALRRIQQSTTSQAPPVKESQDKPLKVLVSGTVSQRNDGLLDLSLEGRGIMEQATNALGMA